MSTLSLQCVDCKGSLGELTSPLECPSCRRAYRTKDGVWDFLPESLESVKINENLAHQTDPQKFWRRFISKRSRIELFEKQWLDQVASDSTNSFLELGGGTCYASALVKERFPGTTVFATDVSILYLARHSVTTGRLMEAPADVYAAVDGETLPFEDGQLDSIFSQMVLYRVPHPEKMLKEIYRVLAPGGRYIGVERASPSWSIALQRKERWLTDRAERLGLAERPVTLVEWRRHLQGAGLDPAAASILPGQKIRSERLRRLVNTMNVVHIAIRLKKPPRN